MRLENEQTRLQAWHLQEALHDINVETFGIDHKGIHGAWLDGIRAHHIRWPVAGHVYCLHIFFSIPRVRHNTDPA